MPPPHGLYALPPAATASVSMTALPNATATAMIAILCNADLVMRAFSISDAIAEPNVFTASEKRLGDLAVSFSGVRKSELQFGAGGADQSALGCGRCRQLSHGPFVWELRVCTENADRQPWSASSRLRPFALAHSPAALPAPFCPQDPAIALSRSGVTQGHNDPLRGGGPSGGYRRHDD